VAFARGGAEIFADDLVAELRSREHEAALVTVPYKWYPGERVLSQAFLWRLLDLTEADGRPIDLVVATKFPSYCVRHPNKVVWLLHQFRQAYELDRTELGQFSESVEDRATRRSVQRLDRTALGEARKLFATSRNVAERLQRSTGLDAEMLPHPPQELSYRTEAFLAEKPVVTTTDAGGPLDVVRDRETGRVVEPTVEAVAAALAIGEDDARTWGRAGKAVAEQVTWGRAIDRLLA